MSGGKLSVRKLTNRNLFRMKSSNKVLYCGKFGGELSNGDSLLNITVQGRVVRKEIDR